MMELRLRKRLQLIFLCGFIFVTSAVLAQDRDLKRVAEQYMSQKKYADAAAYFQEYCQSNQKDIQSQLQWSQALFHANQLAASISILETLKGQNKRLEDDISLLLGKAYHHQHQWSAAIRWYKRYLNLSDAQNSTRQQVIDDIKRCAQGLKHGAQDEEVFIENMGRSVNTSYDEFHPIASPNVDSRIYFTSNKDMRVTDQFDDQGEYRGSVQQHDCNMYGTEISNGAWSDPFPLNSDLNTNSNEELQDFSEDGMVAFFSKGSEPDAQSIYLDSFDNADQPVMGVPWDFGVFLPDEVIRGLHFFADSILLFSSNRPGGLGGFDLYICAYRNGQWSEGINLGTQINSRYDEVSPFLAYDGRTLFFSSNRLTSIGGHDIFQTRFDDQKQQWQAPDNLSMPINSGADDLHFRISKSGLTAHFASARKSGKGGFDIYAAYYRSPVQAQLVRSTPPIFYMVKDFQLFSESLASEGTKESNPSEGEILESKWELPSIIYREDDQVVTPQNQTKLATLVGFLKTYPHLRLEIISHSDQSSVSNFDLFFSIKRAESVAAHLIAQGVAPERVHVKGLGGNYPYTFNQIDGKENKAGRFF